MVPFLGHPVDMPLAEVSEMLLGLILIYILYIYDVMQHAKQPHAHTWMCFCIRSFCRAIDFTMEHVSKDTGIKLLVIW